MVNLESSLGIKGRGGFTGPEDTELDEDGYIFNHCAEGADEPGEVGEDVLFFLGVEDDLLKRLVSHECI